MLPRGTAGAAQGHGGSPQLGRVDSLQKEAIVPGTEYYAMAPMEVTGLTAVLGVGLSFRKRWLGPE